MTRSSSMTATRPGAFDIAGSGNGRPASGQNGVASRRNEKRGRHMRPRTAFIWGTFGARLAMICQSVVGTCHLGAEGVERETQIVRHLDPKCLGALPTASGVITRLAFARGREAGIELGPLLKKTGL